MQEKYAFMQKKCKKIWSCQKKAVLLHPLSFEDQGAIAQLVEQRTENPCVTGSIPVGTTKKAFTFCESLFCIFFDYENHKLLIYLSASIAALAPLPAATIAWR